MRRFRRLGILALALGLWGCDGDGPMMPTVGGPLVAPGETESTALRALGRKPVEAGAVVPLWHGQLGRTAAGWVGLEGGVLEVAGVRLAVPAGAVRRPRFMALHVPGGNVVQAKLWPHGLDFERSATLTFSLEGTEVEGDPDRAGSLVGVYFVRPIGKDGTVVVEELVPLRLESADRVTLTIDHFSGYTPAGG